jgi:hypothetical protein
MQARSIVLSLLATSLLLDGSVRAAAQKPEELATIQAQAWLALVDQGQYEKSWDTAAQVFKAAVTRDQWKQAANGVRGPLGKLIARTLKSSEYKTTLPGAPDGKYVVIQYTSHFANKQEAVETVTPMLDPDGSWRVSGYFIR